MPSTNRADFSDGAESLNVPLVAQRSAVAPSSFGESHFCPLTIPPAVGQFCCQGSMISIPVPVKSLTLRVASVAL